MKKFSALMIIFMLPFAACKSLNEAAEKGDASRVRSLISSGTDINAKDAEGRTALMYAARNGQGEVVRILIEAGADVNARDNEGMTAVMYAAGGSDADTVRYLVAGKADVEAVDNSGAIALYRTRPGTKVREVLLEHSVKYRSQFLCRVNTLFKHLKKYPELTVSYQGNADSGIGVVYYGDGQRLERHEGILPEMIAALKKYGVVFTEDLNNDLDKCGK